MNLKIVSQLLLFLLFSSCKSISNSKRLENENEKTVLKNSPDSNILVKFEENSSIFKRCNLINSTSLQLVSSLCSNQTKNITLADRCFEDLGCVSGEDFQYNSTLKTPPLKFTDPNDMAVTFNLFTLQNPNNPQVFDYKPNDTEISDSLFSVNRKTKLIIHGYLDGLKKSQWITEMKDYLLNHSDYNVVAVDWSKAASSIFYFQAAADTRVVGAMLAHFLNKLVNVTNVTESSMHCIGHSLGAHVCGFAGHRLKNPKLTQISGLDPAGPGFFLNKPNTRLDPTDAELVVIIHTNAGIFTTEGWFPIELAGVVGNNNELGHFDFWPNGGSRQPGCGILQNIGDFPLDPQGIFNSLACNHRRSHYLPISPPNNNCQNIGYECDNYLDFQNGKCADCGPNNIKCKPMEFDFEFWDNFDKSQTLNASEISKSNHYLKTDKSKPFCIFHYQILVQISKDSNAKAIGRLELSLSNNDQVSFPPPLKPFDGPVQIPLMRTFEAGTNYTQLYVNSNELEDAEYLSVKWSSILWAKVNVGIISINFMSHIDESVRHQKSSNFCLKSGKAISSGTTVLFEKCLS